MCAPHPHLFHTRKGSARDYLEARKKLNRKNKSGCFFSIFILGIGGDSRSCDTDAVLPAMAGDGRLSWPLAAAKENSMTKIPVYQYTQYTIANDQMNRDKRSRDFATLAKIKKIGCSPFMDSMREVDEKDLIDGELFGK
jgi:hypothetical protein